MRIRRVRGVAPGPHSLAFFYDSCQPGVRNHQDWPPVTRRGHSRLQPEMDQEAEGTRPAVFEEDVRALHTLLDRFTSQPRDFEWPQSHPHFGKMSEAEWMRLAYLHVDHHLRQFGA